MKSSLGASRMDGSPPLRLHRASPLVVPAGADGAQLLPRAHQVRRRRSRSLGSPQHPRRRLILRVSLPRLAVLFCQTHIHAHAQKRVLFLFSFFFFLLSFFSSRANPELGPGLPLRCSLAHKHKTAFIILPVAAQGLASKSY